MRLFGPFLVGYEIRKGVEFGRFGIFARMATVEPLVHIHTRALSVKCKYVVFDR